MEKPQTQCKNETNKPTVFKMKKHNHTEGKKCQKKNLIKYIECQLVR